MKPKFTENILQIFCGRLKGANTADHKGQVFRQMSSLPWQLIVPQIYPWIYFLGVFDYRGEIIVNQENGKAFNQNSQRVPSLFAISDHEAVHPDLGSLDEFKNLVGTIHEAGGKVIVDYVANHTAINHAWVKTNPDFYKSDNGTLMREFSQDVYPLNYQNKLLRENMVRVIESIVNWGVDGVRCDMAHLVPNDYWKAVIQEIKQNKPKFVFIAEAYSDSVFDWKPLDDLLLAGFDCVYDEFFYRNLRVILGENRPWTYLSDHLNFLLQRNHDQYLHYLANHDDPLIEGVKPLQEALIALLMIFRGMILIPQGQFTGRKQRLAHHTLEILTEEQSRIEAIPKWFEKLNKEVELIKPRAKKTTCRENGLFTVEVDTEFGPGLVLFNFTNKAISLTPDILMRYSLWREKNREIIPPGKFEFLIEG